MCLNDFFYFIFPFRLQEDFAKVEPILSRASSIDKISHAFIIAKASSFENILEPLSKITHISSSVANGLATNPAFMQRLMDKLRHPKAAVRKNLLKILLRICEAGTLRKNNLIQKYGIVDIVRRLQRD